MSPNITILTSTNPHFPAALRSGPLLAPCPQIWALGNLDILAMPLLGFFCATRCPGNVILRTYDLVLVLREAGVPVIGGFHTPMEKACLEVLLRGQQAVVICPARSIAMATPAPKISEIAPHTVLEGSPDFEVVVRGVGFVSTSVVRVDGISVPTTFVSPRVLKAKIPASVVKSATPNSFDAPGPIQHPGVFGDPTVSISVYTPPPEGGTSNSVSLRIRAKWMGLKDEVWD